MFRLFSAFLLTCAISAPTWGAFDLTINVPVPGSFTPTQYTNLTNALDTAEALWERTITGYQTGIHLTGVSINVIVGSGFAEASFPTTVNQGGYALATSSTISINPAVIDMYASWTGEGPPNPNPAYIGLNYLDDILAHEIGHALGIGPLWGPNGVYAAGSGQYTGEYGVRAYQAEFDAAATFVPVELAGNPGTIGLHWSKYPPAEPEAL